MIQTLQHPNVLSPVFSPPSHSTVFRSLFLANHAHQHRHPPLGELTPERTSQSSSQPSQVNPSPSLPRSPHTLHLPHLPQLYTPSCCCEDSTVFLKWGTEQSGDVYLSIILDPTRAGRNHGNFSVCVVVGGGGVGARRQK